MLGRETPWRSCAVKVSKQLLIWGKATLTWGKAMQAKERAAIFLQVESASLIVFSDIKRNLSFKGGFRVAATPTKRFQLKFALCLKVLEVARRQNPTHKATVAWEQTPYSALYTAIMPTVTGTVGSTLTPKRVDIATGIMGLWMQKMWWETLERSEWQIYGVAVNGIKG